MYIIIGGAGLIGRGLVERLNEGTHDIVVIDRDREVCEDIYSRFGAVTVCGSATDVYVLEDAGISKCDVVVATMGTDIDNLALCVLAKSFGVGQIQARMKDSQYETAYRQAGVTSLMRMADLIIDQFVMSIEAPEIRKVVTLGGDVDVSFVTIPVKAKCAGYKIREIAGQKGFPVNCVIVGIYIEDHDATVSGPGDAIAKGRNPGQFIVPRGDAELKEGDRIFLSATPEDTKKAAAFLTEKK